jgi:hypothetical protein
MIHISDRALDVIRTRSTAIHLTMPASIEACCFEFLAPPEVRLGEPRKPGQHKELSVRGVRVFLPLCFRPLWPLTIQARSWLGWGHLYVDGWRLA